MLTRVVLDLDLPSYKYSYLNRPCLSPPTLFAPMSSSRMNHEVETALGYYSIYKLSSLSSPEGRGDDDKSENIESNRHFWEEDEWTPQADAEAEEVLSRAAPPCVADADAVTRYESEAMENWDRFYASHRANFFKDRHYLHKVRDEKEVYMLTKLSVLIFISSRSTHDFIYIFLLSSIGVSR